MPKLVDHELRRRAIAEALWRLADREGLDAINIRAVARESGWSTGVVAHYFADKDDLLAFAFELVGAGCAGRAERARDDAPDRRTALRAMLAEALPLDDRRRLEATIWFGFLVRAAAVPRMGEVVRRRYADWTAQLAAELAATGSPDPEGAARELIALVDGLALQALSSPEGMPPEAQERLVAGAVGRLARAIDD